MNFNDALTLDKTNYTPEGYLVVRARAARTGVYDYSGVQVDPDNKHGLKDQAVVKVLRDADTVFDARAMASFVGKPVTIGHPTVAVTSDNWKDYSSGAIHRVARDGDYFDITAIISDQAGIDAVNGGTRELSNGYTAELEFGDFIAPDGTRCPVRQSRITGGNHVALVDRGRAGPECAIKDFAVCDANPLAIDSINYGEKKVKKITLDGLIVDLSDAEAVQAAFAKKDEATKAAKEIADKATAALADATGKMTVLEAELADAKKASEPAAVKAAVAARVKLIADAAKLTDMAGAEDMSEEEIKKKALKAKLGDAADKLADNEIDGAFAYAVAMPATDILAKSIMDSKPLNDNALEKIKAASLAALQLKYKGA
jgi:hypothetical protein